MTSKDDMVIRPRLEGFRASAPVRAREERRIAGAKRKGGLFRRLAQLRAARRLSKIRKAQGVRRASGFAKAARGGALRTGAGFVAKRGATAAALNPIGALVTGLFVASAVALRLASGRSFENMGQQLNNVLIGDMDETARAKMAARHQLSGDRDIAYAVGIRGRANSHHQRIFDTLVRLRKIELQGAAAIRSDLKFDVNGKLDMVILRARDWFIQAWNGDGGPDSIEKVRKAIHERLPASSGGPR